MRLQQHAINKDLLSFKGEIIHTVINVHEHAGFMLANTC